VLAEAVGHDALWMLGQAPDELEQLWRAHAYRQPQLRVAGAVERDRELLDRVGGVKEQRYAKEHPLTDNIVAE
jgi:hypothetical protein